MKRHIKKNPAAPAIPKAKDLNRTFQRADVEMEEARAELELADQEVPIEIERKSANAFAGADAEKSALEEDRIRSEEAA